MGHQLALNKKNITKVGNILPRLKHAVEPIKLINWLENFDENELDLAIDLLNVFEYIPFNEFMSRLNDLLNEILDEIPKGEKIIIFPYGKVGKSGTLVTYPLKNTNAYKRREEDIELNHDYKYLNNPGQYKHFVFLDDFIGSGKTFCKIYSKQNGIQNWIKNSNIEKVYVLATIVMVDGKKYINDRFKDIKIVAEERNKIFDKELSPLKVFGNLEEIKLLAKKYGDTIRVGRFPAFAPFGFDNSESLISYFHCTPNNTLSIIWGRQKKWKPLFPREANIRMNEAREFKKEIAFYIGICNRLGIDIYTGKGILEEKQGKEVRKIKHNTKQDHSVVALLFLKNQGLDNVLICHLLGVTRTELRKIYIEAERLKLITKKTGTIKPAGINFLKELKEKTKSENFKKETKYSLRIKHANGLYIPEQHNGMI